MEKEEKTEAITKEQNTEGKQTETKLEVDKEDKNEPKNNKEKQAEKQKIKLEKLKAANEKTKFEDKLATVAVLRNWSKKKYQDIGNLQKIIRESQKTYLKHYMEKYKDEDDNIDMDKIEKKMLGKLCELMSKLYPEGIESLIIQEVKDPNQIFYCWVFKSDSDFHSKFYVSPKSGKFYLLNTDRAEEMSFVTDNAGKDERIFNILKDKFDADFENLKGIITLLAESNKEKLNEFYGSPDLDVILNKQKEKLFEDILKQNSSVIDFKSHFFENLQINKEEIEAVYKIKSEEEKKKKDKEEKDKKEQEAKEDNDKTRMIDDENAPLKAGEEKKDDKFGIVDMDKIEKPEDLVKEGKAIFNKAKDDMINEGKEFLNKQKDELMNEGKKLLDDQVANMKNIAAETANKLKGEMMGKVSDLSKNIMSGGLGGLGGAFGDVGNTAGEGLGKGLGDVKNSLGDAVGKSKEALTKGFGALKEAPDKLLQKGKEKLNDITKTIGNTNLLDIKNSCLKIFTNAKSLLEKPKTEKEKSIDYIKKLLEMFKNLDDSSIDLLKMYLTNFTLEKAKALAEKQPDKYAEEMQKIEDLLEEERKKTKKSKPIEEENLRFATNLFHVRRKYFIFHFEEFLLVFMRYMRFLVGMQAKVEFFESQEVFVYFFLHKKALPVMADSLNYELQLKPYADQFRLFLKKKFEKGGKKKLNFKEEEELLVKMLKKNETFDELDTEDQLKFPPYSAFNRTHASKYRKYWNDDDFHLCYKDVEFRRYIDIYKDGLFIDVDLHEDDQESVNDSFDEAEEENQEGILAPLSKQQKIEKRLNKFLDFKYENDEDALSAKLDDELEKKFIYRDLLEEDENDENNEEATPGMFSSMFGKMENALEKGIDGETPDLKNLANLKDLASKIPGANKLDQIGDLSKKLDNVGDLVKIAELTEIKNLTDKIPGADKLNQLGDLTKNLNNIPNLNQLGDLAKNIPGADKLNQLGDMGKNLNNITNLNQLGDIAKNIPGADKLNQLGDIAKNLNSIPNLNQLEDMAKNIPGTDKLNQLGDLAKNLPGAEKLNQLGDMTKKIPGADNLNQLADFSKNLPGKEKLNQMGNMANIIPGADKLNQLGDMTKNLPDLKNLTNGVPDINEISGKLPNLNGITDKVPNLANLPGGNNLPNFEGYANNGLNSLTGIAGNATGGLSEMQAKAGMSLKDATGHFGNLQDKIPIGALNNTGNLIGNLQTNAGGLLNFATGQLNGLQNSAGGALANLQGGAALLQGKAANLAGDLQGKASNVIGDLQGKASNVVGDLQGKASNVVGDLQGKASTIVGDLQGKAAGLVGDLQGKASNVVGDLQGKAAGLVGDLQGKASGLVGDLQGKASGLVGDLQGKASGLVGDLQGKASGLVGDLQGKASGLVGDLQGKASGLVGDLQGKAAGVLDNIQNNEQIQKIQGVAGDLKKEMQNNPHLKEIVLGIICCKGKKKIKKKRELCHGKECTIFRNIDKIRILYQTLDEMVNMEVIKNESNFQDEFFLRNFKPVQDNCSIGFLIIKRWNIFSYVAQIELIQFIRNFFCEKIAYYFLWMVAYIRFLFILAIFSGGVYGIMNYQEKFNSYIVLKIPSLEYFNFSLDFNSMDLIYLIFCSIVAIWSSLFFSYWENAEEYYAYVWGTENVESTEPFREGFKPEKLKEFIFEKKIPSQRKWIKRLKQAASACIIGLMGYITILIANGLLQLNPDNYSNKPNNNTNTNSTGLNGTFVNQTIANITEVVFEGFAHRLLQTGNSTVIGNTNGTHNNGTQSVDDILKNTDVKSFAENPWPVLIGIFNGIQIQLMSWGYSKLALLLTDWENYEKESEYENNYIIKIMVYDFINNFNSLFNIAFVKPFTGAKCTANNCMTELNTQIYTIMLVKLTSKWTEFLKMFLINRETERSYIVSFKEQRVDTSMHSAHHQRMCNPFISLSEDFNEMVFQFCYVAFFSSACPLVPLISLAINILKKNIDAYKICNYKKVNMIQKAKGIQVYNLIFKIFYYFGLISNITVVLFSNSSLDKMDLYVKFLIMIIFINMVLLISSLIDVSCKPKWFKNRGILNSVYQKKFMRAAIRDLPHLDFIDPRNGKKTKKEKIANEEDQIFTKIEKFNQIEERQMFQKEMEILNLKEGIIPQSQKKEEAEKQKIKKDAEGIKKPKENKVAIDLANKLQKEEIEKSINAPNGIKLELNGNGLNEISFNKNNNDINNINNKDDDQLINQNKSDEEQDEYSDDEDTLDKIYNNIEYDQTQNNDSSFNFEDEYDNQINNDPDNEQNLNIGGENNYDNDDNNNSDYDDNDDDEQNNNSNENDADDKDNYDENNNQNFNLNNNIGDKGETQIDNQVVIQQITDGNNLQIEKIEQEQDKILQADMIKNNNNHGDIVNNGNLFDGGNQRNIYYSSDQIESREISYDYDMNFFNYPNVNQNNNNDNTANNKNGN